MNIIYSKFDFFSMNSYEFVVFNFAEEPRAFVVKNWILISFDFLSPNIRVTEWSNDEDHTFMT